MSDLASREAAALLPVYRRQPVEFVSGHGVWLVDAAGVEYLDGLSGLAVTGLGHAHPAVAEAVAAQARTLVHTSNLFYTAPQVTLAERLAATLGWEDAQTFFANSGAEANEAALKLARRHGKARDPDKVRVVALAGSFHGRTLATLLATGNPDKHAPFAPLGEWITHVPYDDAEALTAAVTDDVCAVLVEVVQGEGGVRPVPVEVLHAARAACDRADALLVVDEVQTGLGRLGTWYGWQGVPGDSGPPVGQGVPGDSGPPVEQGTPVSPDAVTLAKALGNGLPIGALVARGEAAKAFGPGDHATTFGGGPVVCAAALAVLDVIDREGLVDRAAALGKRLGAGLDELTRKHEVATGVRGQGLLQALVLDRPVAAAVTEAALARRLVVNNVAADAVRVAPPLVISEALIDEVVARLSAAIADATGD